MSDIIEIIILLLGVPVMVGLAVILLFLSVLPYWIVAVLLGLDSGNDNLFFLGAVGFILVGFLYIIKTIYNFQILPNLALIFLAILFWGMMWTNASLSPDDPENPPPSEW